MPGLRARPAAERPRKPPCARPALPHVDLAASLEPTIGTGRLAWLGASQVQEGVYVAARDGVHVTLLLTEPLVEALEEGAMSQLRGALQLPGVERVVVTPDVHTGYAVPIGFTAISATHLYPDTVGPDPACSVSLSHLGRVTLDGLDKRARRAILGDLEGSIGVASRRRGRRRARSGSRLGFDELLAVARGERRQECTWVSGSPTLPERFSGADLNRLTAFLRELASDATLGQIGTIGGGNHFLEVQRGERGDHYVMAHFGSRGLGGKGSERLFSLLREDQRQRGGGLAEGGLLWVEAASPLGRLYEMFQQAMLEYASYHHAVVQRIACEVLAGHVPASELPSFAGHIPHNFIELRRGRYWQRKGATPAYADATVPLLIPGSMSTASYVLAPGPNADRFGACVPHGAGRQLSRHDALRSLDQDAMDAAFDARGVMGNFRHVPLDESSGAYKDVDEVIRAVTAPGVARVVDRLQPLLVLKGA